MSTTALRIELLIIGFQATIWMLLFLGIDTTVAFYTQHQETIKETSAIITLIVLAWCYSLGATIDGFTAIIEDPKSILKSTTTSTTDSSMMRLKFHEAYKELISSDFELRLLRSTAFNLFLTSLAIFVKFKISFVAPTILISSVAVGVAWLRRRNKSENRRNKLYDAAKRLA